MIKIKRNPLTAHKNSIVDKKLESSSNNYHTLKPSHNEKSKN